MSNKIQAVQQLFSILLTKYAGFDSYSAISANTVIGMLLADYEFDLYTISYACCLLGLVYYIYNYAHCGKLNSLLFFRHVQKTVYSEVLIVNSVEADSFIRYMLKNPEYFDVLPKFKHATMVPCLYWFDDDISFNFYDKFLDVKGVITVLKINRDMYRKVNVIGEKDNSTALIHKNEPTHFLQIRTNKIDGKNTAFNYLENVCDKMSEYYAQPRYLQIFKEKNLDMNLHSRKSFNKDEMQTKYLDSYFSSEKERLWKTISKIWFQPEEIERFGQYPTFNMLMYGPPGTGKSTFAYRVANCLDCHLVSVNLLHYILEHPSNIQAIFDIFSYKSTIYIIDEFDMLIDYLVNIPDFEEKEEIVNGTVVKTKIYTTKFRLKDLLTLFQGAVPIYKRFIFACTNDYERIKDMCPALFRAGRLTPVFFDNLNWKCLNDLCQYYFGKTLTHEQSDSYRCSIPTSEIVELALECVGEDFEVFEKLLIEKLKL
jgi:hypothetical protein